MLDGLATGAAASAPTVIGSTSAAASTSPQADDPATSPYPIWSPGQAYETDYKVVWRRNVYEAKWFSQGQAPDQPGPSGAPSPWSLLGPVLPGEHPPALVRLAGGTFPAWSATAVYRAGARVLFHGLPYQAKWYASGDVPDGSLSDVQQSPWEPLYASRESRGERASPPSAAPRRTRNVHPDPPARSDMRLIRQDQARRRQWGADRHGDPMPALPVPVGDLMVTLGRLAIVGTVVIWLVFVVRTVVTQLIERPPGSPASSRSRSTCSSSRCSPARRSPI